MTEARPLSRRIPRDHSPVRLAVAGLGSMGGIHIKAAAFLAAGISEDYYKSDLPRQIRRLTLCAVCDLDPEKQKEFPAHPFYQNWGDLLRNEKPHLAIVAAPTHAHFTLAVQALEMGVHTLVEKPIAPTLEACRTLLQCADAHGCRVQAGHVERYNPVAIKLHSLIAGRKLQIRHYRFERSQPLPERIPDDIITDKLIHDLDLAIYFFGPVSKTGILRCRRVDGRIMEIEIQLEHVTGTGGTLFVSWLVPAKGPKRRQVRMQNVQGENISGDFVTKALSIAGVEVTCGVHGWIAPVNNQIKDQLADFLAYCLEPDAGIPPPLLSRAEMLASIQLIEEIRSASHHV